MRKRTKLSQAVACALMIGLSTYAGVLSAASSGGSIIEYDSEIYYVGVSEPDNGVISGGRITVDSVESENLSNYVAGVALGDSSGVKLSNNHTLLKKYKTTSVDSFYIYIYGAHALNVEGTATLLNNSLYIDERTKLSTLWNQRLRFIAASASNVTKAVVSSNTLVISDQSSFKGNFNFYGGTAENSVNAEVADNEVIVSEAIFEDWARVHSQISEQEARQFIGGRNASKK